MITDSRDGTIPVYDKRFTTIFPRMWSAQKPEHKRMYNQYATNATTIQVNGENMKKPSFGDNLGFFFDYQLGHMYFRYFMWNFVGRQNDIESQPGPKNGNWISGIGFIDNARLASQNDLPESMKNPAHNKFYFLPLILGLIGLFYHLNSSKRDTLVVALSVLYDRYCHCSIPEPVPIPAEGTGLCLAGSFLCLCHMDWIRRNGDLYLGEKIYG